MLIKEARDKLNKQTGWFRDFKLDFATDPQQQMIQISHIGGLVMPEIAIDKMEIEKLTDLQIRDLIKKRLLSKLFEIKNNIDKKIIRLITNDR